MEDKKLKQVVMRNYAEIASEEYRFDRLETEVKFLNSLAKADMVTAYTEHILNNNRQLLIAVEGIFKIF